MIFCQILFKKANNFHDFLSAFHHNNSSEIGSFFKGKNLLLVEQLFSFKS